MIKLRLPKPAATNVVSRHLYLGSVYTKEQMRAFAEKAVKAEREACADLLEHGYIDDGGYHLQYAKEIRARGK